MSNDPTPVTPDSKPWYMSKVLWVNIATLVVNVGAVVLQQAGDLHISAEAVSLLNSVVAIANLLLRVMVPPTTLTVK